MKGERRAGAFLGFHACAGEKKASGGEILRGETFAAPSVCRVVCLVAGPAGAWRARKTGSLALCLSVRSERGRGEASAEVRRRCPGRGQKTPHGKTSDGVQGAFRAEALGIRRAERARPGAVFRSVKTFGLRRWCGLCDHRKGRCSETWQSVQPAGPRRPGKPAGAARADWAGPAAGKACGAHEKTPAPELWPRDGSEGDLSVGDV